MKIMLLVGICGYATEAIIHFDREIGFVIRNINNLHKCFFQIQKGETK